MITKKETPSEINTRIQKKKRKKGILGFVQQSTKKEDNRNGNTYESGIALYPKGMPKECLKCPYHHPSFCTKLGHISCTSKDCGMFGKGKKIRDNAKQFILDKMIEHQIALEVENTSKFFVVLIL